MSVSIMYIVKHAKGYNMKYQDILLSLKIEDEVLSIWPYGSIVYGNTHASSDKDFVIVMQSARLADGSFRSNAISNQDKTIQAVLYSRSGFIDAINTYDIRALECLSTNPIMNTWPFKIQKWNEKDLVKSIITKASNSRFIADKSAKNDNTLHAKKGMFHALRILNFGFQLKENKKIVDFSACNELYTDIMNDDEFDTRNYYKLFDELKLKLEK